MFDQYNALWNILSQKGATLNKFANFFALG